MCSGRRQDQAECIGLELLHYVKALVGPFNAGLIRQWLQLWSELAAAAHLEEIAHAEAHKVEKIRGTPKS